MPNGNLAAALLQMNPQLSDAADVSGRNDLRLYCDHVIRFLHTQRRGDLGLVDIVRPGRTAA